MKLYVNGKNPQTLKMNRTAEGEWNVIYTFIELKNGINTIELKSESQPEGKIILDNLVLAPISSL